MDNHCPIQQKEIMQKIRKAKLSFLSRHVIWSCCTFLPSIIKIFQRVFDLKSRHEINRLSLSNITKGDNANSKKGRVFILVRDMLSGPVLHFCQVPSKYSKGYSRYRADTKSFSNKTKGDNSKNNKRTMMVLYRSPEQTALHTYC